MGKKKIDKVIVARKLLEKYLEHQREGIKAHRQGRFVITGQQNKLRDAHAKLWQDFDFDEEFGLIGDPFLTLTLSLALSGILQRNNISNRGRI